MSIVISVRVEDELKYEIEKTGYTPSVFVRRALERELKRVRSKEALEWLERNRIPSTGTPSEELIREDRDSR